jgi:AraC family transcriptional regulator, positive regulator of tynA and feaB
MVPVTPERWQVRGVHGAAALDAWAGVLADTHIPFDVHPTYRTPKAFQGMVTRRRFGDLMLVDCASSPFLGHWDLNEPGEPIVGFQLMRKGVEQVRERGRKLAMTAGDMILWDGLQPVDVEVVEPFVKRTLIFPRESVMAVCPRLADVKALPPLKQGGATRLLVRYVNALAHELPQLDGPASAAAASAALELLRAAVEPSLPSSRSARRTALQSEVRRYVRTHLQDPALGPETIAHAHAMSVRALHALFEDAPESVATLVRRERLSRCLEDLRFPNGGSITEIAFRWGFRDAAHFSRVFKREFDMTPSEARRLGH